MKFNLYNTGNDYIQSGWVRIKNNDNPPSPVPPEPVPPGPIPPEPEKDPILTFDGKTYTSIKIGKYFVTREFLESTTGLIKGKDYLISDELMVDPDSPYNVVRSAQKDWVPVENLPISYSRNAIKTLKEKLKNTGWRIPNETELTEIITELGLVKKETPEDEGSDIGYFYWTEKFYNVIGGTYARVQMDPTTGDVTTPISTKGYAAIAVDGETDREAFVQGPNEGGGILFRTKNSYAKTILLIHD